MTGNTSSAHHCPGEAKEPRMPLPWPHTEGEPPAESLTSLCATFCSLLLFFQIGCFRIAFFFKDISYPTLSSKVSPSQLVLPGRRRAARCSSLRGFAPMTPGRAACPSCYITTFPGWCWLHLGWPRLGVVTFGVATFGALIRPSALSCVLPGTIPPC